MEEKVKDPSSILHLPGCMVQLQHSILNSKEEILCIPILRVSLQMRELQFPYTWLEYFWKQAISLCRDIARSFAIQESIRFYFSESFYKPSDRYISFMYSALQKFLFYQRCGEDLMHSSKVQQYLYGDVSQE